jgi:hypothetical protein
MTALFASSGQIGNSPSRPTGAHSPEHWLEDATLAAGVLADPLGPANVVVLGVRLVLAENSRIEGRILSSLVRTDRAGLHAMVAAVQSLRDFSSRHHLRIGAC